MTVKTKLLLIIGFLIIVATTTIGALSYFNFSKHSNEAAHRLLKERAVLVADAVEQQMGRFVDTLAMVAPTLPINDEGEINFNSAKPILEELDGLLGAEYSYVGLEDGVTYLSSGRIPNFNAVDKKREWHRRIFAGERNLITRPYLNSEGGRTMAVCNPVLRNGKPIAALCVNIALDTIVKHILSITSQNHIFVARPDGYVVSAHAEALIGEDLYEVAPSYRPYRNLDYSEHYYEYDGVDYFVISTRAKALGWSFWAWEPVEDITEPSYINLIETVGVTLFLMVVSIVVLFITITKLVYVPIGGEPSEIERRVVDVSEGDLRFTGSSENEVGVMHATSNMIIKLREVIHQINVAAEDLGHTSTEISESASDNTHSTKEQMLQLEQTATAMAEMTATVDEVARSSLAALTSAEEAQGQSEAGLGVVEEMNVGIDGLREDIENVTDVITRLETETQNIGSILEVIDGISEQTNLLALNAAIEAARAGEAGRGFAVVADEVRDLANRTKSSTSEIQEMIGRLQAEAKRSVDMMIANVEEVRSASTSSNQAAEALRAIKTAVEVIVDTNNQIATATEEQTHVAAEINVSINDINDAAKSGHELSIQNGERAQRLNIVADDLTSSVSAFKL